MSDFQVGSTVRIRQGARDMNYGCLFASFVYNRDYTVLEIRGDRVVFGWSNGAITGVTQRSNIIYNGSSGGQPEVSNKSVAPSNPDDYSWGSVKNDFADAAVGESERFTCSTNEDISSGHKLANYFTAYARTYYHFTRDVVIINKFTSDDGATLYLNNVAIGHNDAYTGNDPNGGCEVHMHFQKGWNLVEVVVHEVTPPCWWNFKVDPKTNKYCDGQSSLSDYLDAHSIKWYFNKFTDGTGFKIGTNELTDEKYKLAFDQEETVTARLLSAVKAFDGEMSYSFTIKGLAITGLYVNFFKKRGKETDIELRYGREISNITSKTSIENLATALKVTGSNIDAYNHALTLYGYQYDDGDIYVDQTDGTLKSRTALAYYHRYQFGTGEGHITKTFNYDTTNQATLFAKAYEELKKVSVPEINYEVTIQIPPKNVHIGDTIRIIDEKGGLYLRARVIKLVRSFYQNELTITLGDYLIESSQISKQIKDLAQQFALMQQTIPRYTWYAYADDPDGTNISMYPYDSETDNLTGATTYTHFRKYVGIAYNMSSASVSLSDPNIFQWSLIKGEDGIPGSNGADGKTYYFHVAYANKDVNGSIIDFSTTNPDGRAYIGTYSDEYQPDATVPGAYKWQLVKGKDGESSISHIAYCNKDNDGNITDFSTSTNQNRKWIGVAVDYNDTAPTDPTKYTWAKYIGDDGYTPEVTVSKHDGVASIVVKGKDGTSTTTTISDGKDGTSIKGDDAYLHIAYATSADGKENFKTSWFSGATYLGIYSDHTKLDSSTYTDYKWSLIKGKDGTNGIDGHSPTVTATKTGSTTTISVDGVEQATIKDGEKGKDGKEIIGTQYYLSSSSSTRENGQWSNSIPAYKHGYTYWIRQIVKDPETGAITYTDPVTDLGLTSSNETAYEADQLAKKSVKSFIQEYYLSTSKDKLVDGSWSTTFPTKRGIQVGSSGSDTVTFTKTGTLPAYVSYDSSKQALSFSNTKVNGYQEFYSVKYDAATETLILTQQAEHTEDEWYWIRYKTTYSDGSVEYSPSENGKLLDDINELWANVINNTTAIGQTNSKISLTATRTTSLENTVSGKADKSDIDAANDYTDKQVTEVQKQVSSLSVEADGIRSRVERNEEAIGKVKYAETYLKEDGLHVSSSNYTTESTVDGHGMMVKDKNGNVLAQFTTGESQIQNVKITGHIKMGAHEVYKMNDTEWDGSTTAGTGWMWNGG